MSDTRQIGKAEIIDFIDRDFRIQTVLGFPETDCIFAELDLQSLRSAIENARAGYEINAIIHEGARLVILTNIRPLPDVQPYGENNA